MNRRIGRLACAALLAWSTAGAVARPQTTARQPIGVATQEADGTIVLTLRAEASGGGVGDGQLRYAPSNRDYATIARHVGPIPRGGSVPIRPFDER